MRHPLKPRKLFLKLKNVLVTFVQFGMSFTGTRKSLFSQRMLHWILLATGM
jgi:hypothetical protein